MYKFCRDLWIAGELLQFCEESNQEVSFLNSYLNSKAVKNGLSDKDLNLLLNLNMCILFGVLFFLCSREAVKICFKSLKDI